MFTKTIEPILEHKKESKTSGVAFGDGTTSSLVRSMSVSGLDNSQSADKSQCSSESNTSESHCIFQKEHTAILQGENALNSLIELFLDMPDIQTLREKVSQNDNHIDDSKLSSALQHFNNLQSILQKCHLSHHKLEFMKRQSRELKLERKQNIRRSSQIFDLKSRFEFLNKQLEVHRKRSS